MAGGLRQEMRVERRGLVRVDLRRARRRVDGRGAELRGGKERVEDAAVPGDGGEAGAPGAGGLLVGHARNLLREGRERVRRPRAVLDGGNERDPHVPGAAGAEEGPGRHDDPVLEQPRGQRLGVAVPGTAHQRKNAPGPPTCSSPAAVSAGRRTSRLAR